MKLQFTKQGTRHPELVSGSPKGVDEMLKQVQHDELCVRDNALGVFQ